ncbi:hypothetical protein L596_028876 [Steinernema carpocapsae]|uniref:Homeobox domain-containing protein n=1 Tax=Steinernema carpocapsae TaxID=34508 RepID=A0A4U5LZM6_STECR|nr:hypothetical protein L596_028876 [Steinernema carpocapsae]
MLEFDLVKEQTELLKKAFEKNTYLSASVVQDLCEKTGLEKTNVKIWFRVQRYKRKEMQPKGEPMEMEEDEMVGDQ